MPASSKLWKSTPRSPRSARAEGSQTISLSIWSDFRAGVITVPRSKHGESRHIPMNSVPKGTLEELRKRAHSPYIFPVGPPEKWFLKICRRVGISNFSWHCLRHTFASRLVMAGVDLRTVQELMGHKTLAMTLRYSHLSPEHQLDAVQRLNRKPTDTSTGTTPEANKTAVAGGAEVLDLP